SGVPIGQLGKTAPVGERGGNRRSPGPTARRELIKILTRFARRVDVGDVEGGHQRLLRGESGGRCDGRERADEEYSDGGVHGRLRESVGERSAVQSRTQWPSGKRVNEAKVRVWLGVT